MVAFSPAELAYPAGTMEGFYPVIGKKNQEQLWAPHELIKRDNRILIGKLEFLIPTPDLIVPIAKGGLEFGQECGYKIGRKNKFGKSVARIISAQTIGYDENDEPLPETVVTSAPTEEQCADANVILFVDDLTDRNKAMPAVRSVLADRAPHAQLIGVVPWAKRNGAPQPDIVGRGIPDLWVVFENQAEANSEQAWYIDQVLDRYPHYLEDMAGYIAERAQLSAPFVG